jgi:hypothetical protein
MNVTETTSARATGSQPSATGSSAPEPAAPRSQQAARVEAMLRRIDEARCNKEEAAGNGWRDSEAFWSSVLTVLEKEYHDATGKFRGPPAENDQGEMPMEAKENL